jgi:hypothetical protein
VTSVRKIRSRISDDTGVVKHVSDNDRGIFRNERDRQIDRANVEMVSAFERNLKGVRGQAKMRVVSVNYRLLSVQRDLSSVATWSWSGRAIILSSAASNWSRIS